jgi:hypothetical protein
MTLEECVGMLAAKRQGEKIEEVNDVQPISKRIHFFVASGLGIAFFIEYFQSTSTLSGKRPEGANFVSNTIKRLVSKETVFTTGIPACFLLFLLLLLYVSFYVSKRVTMNRNFKSHDR